MTVQTSKVHASSKEEKSVLSDTCHARSEGSRTKNREIVIRHLLNKGGVELADNSRKEQFSSNL